MVSVNYRGKKMSVPCSAWPMSPEEYVQKSQLASEVGSFFTGTVVLRDGKVIEIAVPLDNDVAESIAANSVEFKLAMKGVDEREKRKREELEAKVSDAERQQQEQMRSMQQQRGAYGQGAQAGAARGLGGAPSNVAGMDAMKKKMLGGMLGNPES